MYINRANRFALASIEVTPKDVRCEQRVISASGDRSARTVYDQTVLLKMGGRSMIETKISHSDSTEMLQAGFYTLDCSSYQLGDYGAVELKIGYQQKVVRLADAIAPYLEQLNAKPGRLEKTHAYKDDDKTLNSDDRLVSEDGQSALYLPGTFEFVALDDDAYQCQNEYCELLWSEDKVTFSLMLSYLECPNCGNPVVQLSKETPPKL